MGAVTLGGSTEFNFDGTLAITGAITGGGNALTFSVANLTIAADINGVSTLTIENIDSTGAIDLGGSGAASFVLSSMDLSNIQAGTDVVIGSSSYTGNMTVAGAWSNGLDVTVNFQNGGGGSLSINNAITGTGSLTIEGSGSTTVINADVTQASITINDAVEVQGDFTLTATGAGGITLDTTGFSAGIYASVAGADLSLLASDPVGTVNVTGTFTDNGGGGNEFLSNLTMTSAADVVFNASGQIGGDLSITSGTGLGEEISLASNTGTMIADSFNFAGTSAVLLTGSTQLTTGLGAGDDILFSGTLNGAQTLSLTAGLGNITFTDAVGGGTRLGAIAINSANDVTAVDISAGSLVQTTGQGTTTFNGAQDYSTSVGLNVITDTIVLNGSVVTDTNGTQDGIVTLNANNNNAGAGAGTLTIDGAGDIYSGGAVSLTGSQGILTAGDVTTAGNVVSYASATTLTGNVLVDTTSGVPAGGAITFSSTLGGAQGLGLTAGTTGDVLFNGVVGGAGGVTRLGAMTIYSANDVTAIDISAASLTQTTGQGTTTFNGLQDYNTAAGLDVVTDTIALNQAVTTANGGIVTLNANYLGGVAAGTLTIAALGDITSDGAVDLTGANGIITAGDVTTTGDVVNYNSLTGLTGVILVDTTIGGATGGTITFVSTLDGTQDLGLTAGTTGDVVFGGVVGANTRLVAITINSANDVTAAAITAASLVQTTWSGTTTFGGQLDLTGAFDFTGQVLNLNYVGANTVGTTMDVTNAGLFTTVNGANLTVGSVFVQDGAGVVKLGGNISSGNAMTFQAPLQLTRNVTLQNTAGAIEFASTVDGEVGGVGWGFSVVGAGAVTLGNKVGSLVAPTFVSITGTTIMIDGPIAGTSVRTTGTQQYTGAVTLGKNTTLTGSTMAMGGTVTGGGNSLSINGAFGGGNGVFNGVVSGLSTLSVVNATTINTTGITSSGAQAYTGAVTLGANTTLNAGAGNLVTFGSTVNGAKTLAIAGTSNAQFDGIVGGSTALTSLTVGGASTINTTAITTAGIQTYTGTVTLGTGNDTTVILTSTGGTVSFGGTVNATTTGEQGLTVTGNASFGRIVGGGTALRSLSVSGTTALNTTAITTSNAGGGTGDQTYTGAVTLGTGNDTTVILTSTGGTVSFGGTVNATTAGEQGLTVTGNANFGGIVGGGTALRSLSVSGTTALNTTAITTSNAGGGTGDQTYTGAVSAGAATFAASNAGSIDLSNVNNNFTGVVEITSANGVTLRDANALAIGATSTSGGQVFVAAGSVTSTGAKTTPGNILIQSTSAGVALNTGSSFNANLTQIVSAANQAFSTAVGASAFTGTGQIFCQSASLNTPSSANAGFTGFSTAYSVTPRVTLSGTSGSYTLTASSGTLPSGNAVAYSSAASTSSSTITLTAAQSDSLITTIANLTTIPTPRAAVGLNSPSLAPVMVGAIISMKPPTAPPQGAGAIRVSFRTAANQVNSRTGSENEL
jgi:hypothetical protein